eukprot:220848-Hanusia_phi.AAC.1
MREGVRERKRERERERETLREEGACGSSREGRPERLGCTGKEGDPPPFPLPHWWRKGGRWTMLWVPYPTIIDRSLGKRKGSQAWRFKRKPGGVGNHRSHPKKNTQSCNELKGISRQRTQNDPDLCCLKSVIHEFQQYRAFFEWESSRVSRRVHVCDIVVGLYWRAFVALLETTGVLLESPGVLSEIRGDRGIRVVSERGDFSLFFSTKKGKHEKHWNPPMSQQSLGRTLPGSVPLRKFTDEELLFICFLPADCIDGEPQMACLFEYMQGRLERDYPCGETPFLTRRFHPDVLRADAQRIKQSVDACSTEEEIRNVLTANLSPSVEQEADALFAWLDVPGRGNTSIFLCRMLGQFNTTFIFCSPMADDEESDLYLPSTELRHLSCFLEARLLVKHIRGHDRDNILLQECAVDLSEKCDAFVKDYISLKMSLKKSNVNGD